MSFYPQPGYYNRASLTLLTAPVSEPVTLSDVKDYLRIDGTADDSLISDMIAGARDMVEKYLKRALITQTWKLTLDTFPASRGRRYDSYNGVMDVPQMEYYDYGDSINLAKLPIQSISSIVTYDTANTSSTYAASNYTLDSASGRIFLNDGSVWPTDLRERAAIEITYVAGYGDAASDVPPTIRQGIKSLVGQMYETRGMCEMSCECKSLLSPYKLFDSLYDCT